MTYIFLMSEQKVTSIKIASADYPALLKQIPNAPETLYLLGKYTKSLFDNTLAVVGSRAVTMYGEWIINTIVKEVARAGITIVSGFMYGVDALVHAATLEVGGSTVAVMAGGIDRIFPKYQEALYWDIVTTGLVVSEFYEKPELGEWMFAKRNRIVAGLSKAVLVVEAAENSSSLITAAYAKQYGRTLFAVPANLDSRNAVGTTKLLKDGATMVSCADDILKLYFNDLLSRKKNPIPALNKRLLVDSNDERRPRTILEILLLESLSVDEIASKLKLQPSVVLVCLTGLVMTGQIREKGGRYYAC